MTHTLDDFFDPKARAPAHNYREEAAHPAWLGLDSKTPVPAGQFVSIEPPIFFTFKTERLFVKKACASSFLIHDIFIGARTGRLPGAPIIAEPFAVDFDNLAKIEDALFAGNVIKIVIEKKAADLLGQPWPLPTLRPGIPLSLRIENIGESPCRFLAALYGLVKE
jgi:hypothetical protein